MIKGAEPARFFEPIIDPENLINGVKLRSLEINTGLVVDHEGTKSPTVPMVSGQHYSLKQFNKLKQQRTKSESKNQSPFDTPIPPPANIDEGKQSESE